MGLCQQYTFITIVFVISTFKAGSFASTPGINDCTTTFRFNVTGCCFNNSDGTNLLAMKETKDSKECSAVLEEHIKNSYRSIKQEDTEVIECLMECFFKSQNLLNKNGKIDKAAVISDLGKGLSQWMPVVNESVQTCIEQGTKVNMTSKSKCNSGSIQFLNCFLQETTLKCPDDAWSNSGECNQFRDYLKICPDKISLQDMLLAELQL